MSNLEQSLESSIEAAQTRGHFVVAWELPSEGELAYVHAQLARVCRESRVWRAVQVLPMPVEED